MPTSLRKKSDAHIHSDMLTGDGVGTFVPKSEDMGVSFPSFDPSPSDGLPSSASDIAGVVNSFDPGPSSVMAPSLPSQSVSSMSQLDIDVLDSSTSDDMQGITSNREESPSSAHSPSSNPSLAASPVPPPYSNVSTSSLASALDEPGASLLNRSRSGSLASPSTAGFVSRASPPQSSHESVFKFSAPSGISRPDPVSAPHMLVVDDVLNSIMRAAASARQACSMGQGVEASTKIDEMKKQIALVSDLMSATMLDTPPNQGSPDGRTILSSVSPPSSAQGHRHSLSLPGLNHSQTPGFFSNVGLVSLSSTQASLERPAGGPMAVDTCNGNGLQSSPDSDTSRKRCASSMAESRIHKAIRLDSADGRLPPPTQPATPSTASLNLSSIPNQMLSSSHPPSLIPSPAGLMPGNVQVSAAPTSAPLSASLSSMSCFTPLGASSPTGSSSRPDSPPASLASSRTVSWPMLQKHLSASAPVTTVHPSLTQTQPTFPVTIPSSVPMPTADPGDRDGEFELGSPTSIRGTWPEVPGPGPVPAPLGSGIGTVHPQDLSGPSTIPYEAPPYPPPGHNPISAGPMVSNTGISAATMSRASRSSSFSNPLTAVNPLPLSATNPHAAALVYGAPPPESVSSTMSAQVQHQQPPEFVPSHNDTHNGRARSYSSSSCEEDDDDEYEWTNGHSRGYSFSKASPTMKSRESSRERASTRQRMGGNSPGEGQGSSGHGNDVPPEYRVVVDRIFFEFLNKVCSNLDATDAKGELIHQTLMAKKMQRLDESPDFRPFKFRYSEEKIAMKKVRNYLWTQPYISRFNEDGKKAKSKGNHIWNIDAKKKPEGGWDFRPFHRKLAGSPPSVAYIGLRWSWTPRIWDPQASRANIQVQYSSPNLPSWLSWRDGSLHGTPPPDAQSCEIMVEARTAQDGREELLTQSFLVSVSPVPTGTDISFSGSRPSLVAEIHNPRRVNSDSMVPNVAGVTARPVASLPQPVGQAASLTTQDAQMMQVLTSAAQRVAQEAQAHVIAAHNPNEPPGPELQALAKQQHVLTLTAQALDQEVSAPPDVVSPSSHALVAAAQQVVFQAARQVAADRTAVMSLATGIPAPQTSSAAQVTVNEVSVATQSAVAQAVEITGPLSSEVDVMMTASSLLQQQTRPPIIEPAPLAPTLDAIRPHSTGTVPPQYSIVPSNAISLFPTAVAPLSSMGSIDF
ncbi:hypothetical protein DFH11DRAFT_1724766 [Phellopilus nigrolimitatus]|nr:hypothetical protein DFH11DRAFT_1724766 [Phellopilus nigrolimitatus]